ncbi:MAG: ATP-binding protein [Aureliella sp.]
MAIAHKLITLTMLLIPAVQAVAQSPTATPPAAGRMDESSLDGYLPEYEDLSHLSINELRKRCDSLELAEKAVMQESLLCHPDQTNEGQLELALDMLAEHNASYCPLGIALGWKYVSVACIEDGDLDRALQACERCLCHASEISLDQPYLVYSFYEMKSEILNQLGRHEEERECIRQAIAFGKRLPDGWIPVHEAYHLLAMSELYYGDLERCLDDLRSSFELSVDGEAWPFALHVAGNTLEILIYEDRLDTAEEWLARVEKLVEDVGLELPFAIDLRREKLRTMRGDIETAATNLRSLAASDLSNEDPFDVRMLFSLLANAEFYCDNFVDALEANARSLEGSDPLELRLQDLVFRAKVHSADGNPELALSILDDVESRGRDSDMLQSQIALIRSFAYEALGRSDEALFELQNHMDIESERKNEETMAAMNRLASKLNEVQNEHQLQLARRDTEAAQKLAQRADEAAAQAQNIRNLTIGFSLIGLLASIVIIWLAAERRSAFRLRSKESQLNNDLERQLAKQAAELRQETDTRRELELSLERKYRNEAIGQLTSGVAHDFNNLLTVVIHSAELLEHQLGPLPHKSNQLLQSSKQAANSGATIVSQLLAYARQSSFQVQAFRVSEWLSGIESLLRRSIRESHAYEQKDESNHAHLQTDSAQLTTAVINLLSNANDAVAQNPAGDGLIQLSFSRSYLTQEAISPESDAEPGGFVEIAVSDNGCGMTEEQIQKATEPFFTTKGPAAGTGLGLSSALGFARQSRGELTIESKVGEGTTVRIFLPVAKAETSEPLQLDDEQDGELTFETVLVVDDYEQVRQLASAQLTHLGLSVREAQDATAAIDSFVNDGPPDLLLTDVRMPGPLDGIGLRNWVSEHYPNTRVIVMSGNVDEEKVGDGVSFLRKPFNLKQLRSSIHSESHREQTRAILD